jgi:hypothetical protein
MHKGNSLPDQPNARLPTHQYENTQCFNANYISAYIPTSALYEMH